ncbi:hypothetical protein L6164_004043 [Bauhinia variegata]|uniref:Uncharacterized protein n=1 Tax=Bauhinia variegata TaxID=167791 RepID=A0ACB9Q352_BAUVA|nr:hypothetical protein L6164_004043 [Bauhinia variegata]
MASHGKGLEDPVASSDFYMVVILTSIRALSSLGTVLMFTSCGEGVCMRVCYNWCWLIGWIIQAFHDYGSLLFSIFQLLM